MPVATANCCKFDVKESTNPSADVGIMPEALFCCAAGTGIGPLASIEADPLVPGAAKRLDAGNWFELNCIPIVYKSIPFSVSPFDSWSRFSAPDAPNPFGVSLLGMTISPVQAKAVGTSVTDTVF